MRFVRCLTIFFKFCRSRLCLDLTIFFRYVLLIHHLLKRNVSNCRVYMLDIHANWELLISNLLHFFSDIISSSLQDVTTAHKSSSLKTIILDCLGLMVVFSNFGVNTFPVSGRITNGVERAVGMIPTPVRESYFSPGAFCLARSYGRLCSCDCVTCIIASLLGVLSFVHVGFSRRSITLTASYLVRRETYSTQKFTLRYFRYRFR